VSDPPSRDFAPWFIEFFALACAFGCVDSIREHSSIVQCVSFAAVSLLLAVIGFKWSPIKTAVLALVARWPWNQLRIVKSELTRVLQENSELRESFVARKEAIPLPLSVQVTLAKPQHNVQYAGFEVSNDDGDSVSAATLLFQNVRTSPDQLLGKFEWPRLRVIYYDNSTGQEIADLAPLLWSGPDDVDVPSEINASGSHAIVASYYEAGWHACEIIEPEEDSYTHRNTYRWIDLPTGEVRIIAILSGGYGISPIPHVTGVLTLRQDGAASFQRTSD